MILVELLTNAFKYAFPNNRRGTLDINLVSQGRDMILTVDDDGDGLPQAFDLKDVSAWVCTSFKFWWNS